MRRRHPRLMATSRAVILQPSAAEEDTSGRLCWLGIQRSSLPTTTRHPRRVTDLFRCDVSIPVSWQHPSIPSSSYLISSRPTTERHGSNILPGLCTARTSLLSLCLQLTRLKRSISELSGGVRVEHSQQHNILVIHCLRESSHAIFPRT